MPLELLTALLAPTHADSIDEPGAKISRHEPKLENPDFSFALVIEPTVSTSGSEAGE